MDEMYKILSILVWTLCLTILIGLIGVFYGKVDPQFIEGLVSGALVTLITMMIKDITNQAPDNTIVTKTSTTQPIETPGIPVKTGA